MYKTGVQILFLVLIMIPAVFGEDDKTVPPDISVQYLTQKAFGYDQITEIDIDPSTGAENLTPIVSDTIPNHARQGKFIPFFIIHGYHFQKGAIVNFTAPGLPNFTIQNLTVSTDGRAMSGPITIPEDIPVGEYRVIVHQGSQYSNDNKSFYIFSNPPNPEEPPVITTVVYHHDPYPGKYVEYFVWGYNFFPDAILNLSMTGAPNITLPILYHSSGDTSYMYGATTLPMNTLPGIYRLNLHQKSHYSYYDRESWNITEYKNPPYVWFTSPTGGKKGETIPFHVIGRDFTPDMRVDLVKKGLSNITVRNVTCPDIFTLDGDLSIPSTAIRGERDVIVSKGSVFSNQNVTFMIT